MHTHLDELQAVEVVPCVLHDLVSEDETVLDGITADVQVAVRQSHFLGATRVVRNQEWRGLRRRHNASFRHQNLDEAAAKTQLKKVIRHVHSPNVHVCTDIV